MRFFDENREVYDTLKPTLENVAREFIANTMDDLLFSNELPNFRFDFKEKEGIEFVEKTLKEYEDWFKNPKYVKELEEKHKKMLEMLNKKTEENEKKPVMVITDYKRFFELLRQMHERSIELYFRSTPDSYSDYPIYELRNYLKNIWLRMLPEDFNHPEDFLERQVKMMNDETLSKYDRETLLGELPSLGNNIVTAKNEFANNWDENSREFIFNIYDKNQYYNEELQVKPHMELPLIRYGIYEKDGKKICSIGSIQKRTKYVDEEDKRDEEINKVIDRKKYKVNKGIEKEYTENVEPKNILALSMFIDILNKEGIEEYEIPTMYVLDYEYHEKRSKMLVDYFTEKWNEETIKEKPDIYKEDVYYYKNNFNKQDLVSEIKSERLIKNIERMLRHYQKSEIKSYPGEADNMLHIKIPKIKEKNEIDGDILKEVYELVDKYYAKEDLER